MITSRLIWRLLAALAVLTTTCAVVMAFQLLFGAVQDAPAAAVLRYIGSGCLVLLVVDVLLLIGALAIRDLEHRHDADER